MKRIFILLLPLCLLLTGCGSDAVMQSCNDFSKALAECETAAFTASVHAEYPDRRTDFVLRCEKDGDTCTVTVMEPECIAGIQAVITGGSAKLCYDSVMIETGSLDSDGLSPVSSMPLMFDALEHGFPEAVWREGDIFFWQIVLDDELSAVVSYDSVKSIPVGAELISRGKVIIELEISEWNAKG